jgi:hypothetical protein
MRRATSTATRPFHQQGARLIKEIKSRSSLARPRRELS